MIKNWQDFLDSLSTKGGNIFVLFISVFSLVFLYLHMVHRNSDAASTQVVTSLLTGFGGALLAMLSGNSSRQQMEDRKESLTASPKVDVQKVDTVNVTSAEAGK
jgi:hypothetical protein